MIRACGFAVTVPHAPAAVREHAHYVTARDGGAGAVRELAELILAAQGQHARRRGRRRRRGLPAARHGRRSSAPAAGSTALTAWSPVLLLGGLAALTYWLDAQVQPPAPRRDGSTRHDPDIFVEGFRAVKLDANGRPLQLLAARARRSLPRRPDHRVHRRRRSRRRRPASRRSRHRRTRRSSPAIASTSISRATSRAVRDAATRRPPRSRASGAADADHRVPARASPTDGSRAAPTRPVTIDGAAWNNQGRRAGARQQGQDRSSSSPSVSGTLRAAGPPDEVTPVRHAVACACSPLCALAGAARLRRARREGRQREADRLPGRQPATSTTRTQPATLKGNVIITQGTMTIKADRIDFKQNADNSLSATAYGNPVAFRQKRDGSRRVLRRLRAARRLRRREGPPRALRQRAAEEGADEIRSNYISYNTATGIFAAEGRPDAPPAPATRPRAPTRARHVPAQERRRPPGKDAAAQGQGRDQAQRQARRPPRREGRGRATKRAPRQPLDALKPSGELAPAK